VDNDKAFALWAVTLILVAVSAISTAVMMGIATFPTSLFVLEHLGLGLCFRAAYKSLAGPGWLFGDAEDRAVADAVEHPALSGDMADAMS
jgi:hypothetical protein